MLGIPKSKSDEDRRRRNEIERLKDENLWKRV
jgi:hypothetical protein